ncbi:MAG: hypothetical protein U0694_02890 [Anaerolineae bacterium]
MIHIEGYTIEELLALSDELLAAYVFTNEPMVFRAGTAELLGRFRLADNRLVIELAQIDGGGQGVLPSLWLLANRYARQHQLTSVEWIVHALSCAKPNLKLRRLLKKRGFVVEPVEGVGECYHLVHEVN